MDDLSEHSALDSMDDTLGDVVVSKPLELRSIHLIKTADNVTFNVELAGVGNRIFAFLIDAAVMGLLWGLAVLTAAYATKISKDLSKAMLIILSFLVLYGYHFVQEWLWSGKTLGKFLLNIRVVRNNGQPIGLWESMGRNLFRIIDVLLSGIGLLPMLLSVKEKRFGDFVVGTIVINDQKIETRLPTALSGNTLLERPDTIDETLHSLGQRLTVEEYDLLQSFLIRYEELRATERQRLVHEFKIYMAQRLQLTDAQLDVVNPMQSLYYGYLDALIPA